MMKKNWTYWAAVLASSCILSACGGEGSSETTSQAPTTNPTPATAPGAPVANDEFSGEMVGFVDDGKKGSLNSFTKFMISSAGPQKLLNHLETRKQNTDDQAIRMACDKFITLIKKAYSSQSPLSSETQDLHQHILDILQIKDFDQNEEAAWHFLAEIQDLFDFSSLNEWLTDNPNGPVEGEEITAPEAKLTQFFHDIYLEKAFTHSSNPDLQQAINMILENGPLSLPDVQTAGNLSLMLVPDEKRDFKFDLNEKVELPVFDKKTQKNVLLTLQPSAAVDFVEDKKLACTLIKNSSGQWHIHENAEVQPYLASSASSGLVLLSLSVVGVAPAQ